MVTGWEKVELGKQADIWRGGSPRPIQAYLTTRKDGVNWIKIGDVKPNAKYIYKTDERIVQEGATYSRSVSKGDFILSNSMSFGRPYILKVDGCIHDGWLTIQNYQKNFDTNFLYYVLGSDNTFSQYESMAAGSSVQNLSKDKVAKVIVWKPPLPEQRAIASALSDADAYIAALEKLIAKKRAVKQGVMQELLTGRRRLAGVGGRWVEKRLGDLLQYEQPQKYIVSNTEYVNSGIPVLTAGKSLILGYTNERTGIYENLPVIIFDDFTTASKFITYRFKVKSSAMKLLTSTGICDIRLVYEFMQMIDFPLKDHQRYWISEYSKLTIKIPPTIEEQTAIVAVLTDIDAEIDALTAKLSKAKRIKQGMMSELLTGRIRLVSEDNEK